MSRTLLALYALAAVFLCLCTATSVYRGAVSRMGIAPEPAPREQVDDAAIASCVGELGRLWRSLNARLDATLASSPARKSGADWESWSPTWRTELLQVGARCRLEQDDLSQARSAADLYRRLLALHRHYTTLVVQFSNEIGPHSDNLMRALQRATTAQAPSAP